MFGRVAGNVDLQEHVGRPVQRDGLGADRLQQPQAVGGVDARDEGQGPLDLVPLQVTDHVPENGHVAQHFSLLPKLLRAAFAKVL